MFKSLTVRSLVRDFGFYTSMCLEFNRKMTKRLEPWNKHVFIVKIEKMRQKSKIYQISWYAPCRLTRFEHTELETQEISNCFRKNSQKFLKISKNKSTRADHPYKNNTPPTTPHQFKSSNSKNHTLSKNGSHQENH